MVKKRKKRGPVSLNQHLLVKEVMQTDLITAKFDTNIVDAVEIMREKGVSGLVVLDNVGEFVGVVSALDIFKTVSEGDSIENLLVEDVMTPFTITIHHDENLSTAARTMMENNIHRLVVTDSPINKRPVGIITSTDLINNIL